MNKELTFDVLDRSFGKGDQFQLLVFGRRIFGTIVEIVYRPRENENKELYVGLENVSEVVDDYLQFKEVMGIPKDAVTFAMTREDIEWFDGPLFSDLTIGKEDPSFMEVFNIRSEQVLHFIKPGHPSFLMPKKS